MAKLTNMVYRIKSSDGTTQDLALYTSKEEIGGMAKAIKLNDGSTVYYAIGDTTSKFASKKRFKIGGKEYAALTEAEKKKDKIRKVYIFKAGEHRFKVPFWAKKLRYTICGGGNGIISMNAPILDTIEKDGVTNAKSIMMVRKVNEPMYATIPLMGEAIMGKPTSMYVEIKEYDDDSNDYYITNDGTRTINTANRRYDNSNYLIGDSHWIKQTADSKSNGFSVYQADTKAYDNITQNINTTPVVTKKEVVIAPTMINPDIKDDINYDKLAKDITVGIPMPPSTGTVENEGEYVRISAASENTTFTVYNKGFRALYNVYPMSDMVTVMGVAKFVNETMAKYKVNLVDKDIYHDENNIYMIFTFIIQAYIYNTYTSFDKLYSAGIAMYRDGSAPPSKTDTSIQSSYNTAFNQYKAKPNAYKQRYDNVTYYARRMFLTGTIFDYDYMMQLKENGILDSIINSTMLSNMDLVDGAYDFNKGRYTAPKLTETRLGAREVIFDIQCLDNQTRQLSIKYGGSLALGWDKYFDDAYCYDIEDIDIYRAEEFTKIFNPLSGNIVPDPLDGQELTGTWDVSPGENIVIKVGTHGKLYTEDMGFKLNKYFHDREADGICILELEGDFKDIDDIDNYFNDHINSLTPYQYNQMLMLDPMGRDSYDRYFMIRDDNYSGDIDMSAQDVFSYNRTKVNTNDSRLKFVDGMANSKNINIYHSSRSQNVHNLPIRGGSTINLFGYDMGKANDKFLFHNFISDYESVKMDIAEDLVSNLTEYLVSSNLHRSIVTGRETYMDKEHTFIFKNANKINYAFSFDNTDGEYILPKVKLNYNKALDANGVLNFRVPKELDYRWYVSLGLYINPSTAKNIGINERLFITYPGDNALRNKKVKIFKPWVTYDQSKAYVKYVVPKDYTTNSLVGIVPLLDKSIDNVSIDVTNVKDEPYTLAPIVSSSFGKVQNVHIVDNSGITERKFNGIFNYATKNYLGVATLAPTTMVNFAIGSTADLSDITLNTSAIKDFTGAFKDFNGKFPKNIDLTSCTNFSSLFYSTDLDNITMDSFVDSSYITTKANSDKLSLESMFTTYIDRNISFDLWGFLVKKVKLLEKIKAHPRINMSTMMYGVKGIPFFSIYELFMAALDDSYILSEIERKSGLYMFGFARDATFKELEVPIFNNAVMNEYYIRQFTLSQCGTNGVGKLVFRQLPINIQSLDELKKATTDDSVCGNFLSSYKPDSSTYKLPTTIVVKLISSYTSIPNTTESIEAIKTFLNATYTTPKENISVIFE